MLDDWRGTPNLYVLGALTIAFLLVGTTLITTVTTSAALDRFQQTTTPLPASFLTMQHSMLTAHTQVHRYLATGNTSHRDTMIDALSQMQQAERTYRNTHTAGFDTINTTNDGVSATLFATVDRYESGTSPAETRHLMADIAEQQEAALDTYRAVAADVEGTDQSPIATIQSRIRMATMLLLVAATLLVLAVIGVIVVGPALPTRPRGAEEERERDDLFDQVSAPVLSIRPSGTITAANETAVNRFGYSRDAFLGSDATLIFVDDITETDAWNTVQSGTSTACNMTAVDADGTHHDLHLLLDPTTDDDTVTGVRAVLRSRDSPQE